MNAFAGNGEIIVECLPKHEDHPLCHMPPEQFHMSRVLLNAYDKWKEMGRPSSAR